MTRVAIVARTPRMLWCALWLVCPPALVPADQTPAPGTLDSRIRAAPYVAEEVYRLRGYVGYQIDLQFEAGESFVGLSAGDIESITFAAEANHLFLKPRTSVVETNLTVLTNLRVYHFDYAVTARPPEPRDPDVIYALRFTYPERAASGRSDAELERRLATGPTGPRNLDYWYCGSRALKPVGAWDDGVRTRLRFDPNQEFPAIFLRNDDGSESLVNFTVEGTDAVVHRVGRRFIVRRGKLTGCIVNESFNGGSERPLTGTVTPGVERVTPEPRP